MCAKAPPPPLCLPLLAVPVQLDSAFKMFHRWKTSLLLFVKRCKCSWDLVRSVPCGALKCWFLPLSHQSGMRASRLEQRAASSFDSQGRWRRIPGAAAGGVFTRRRCCISSLLWDSQLSCSPSNSASWIHFCLPLQCHVPSCLSNSQSASGCISQSVCYY